MAIQKNNLKLLRIILSVFFSSLFLVFCFSVFAQETVGLALSPPTFELSANPGDTLENTIQVENRTDRPIEVLVDRRNFTALGEEGAVGLTDEETSFSLASWITISPERGEIPAKGRRVFTFETKVPLNAEPGGHFGSIIFKTGGVKPGQTGAAVSQELGALVLLRVAGKVKEKATLESFSTTKALWEYGPVEFETRVKNEGNVHLKPIGTITISDFFGRKIETLEIEPRNVLPGAIRKISASWDRHFLLGKYTATISLTSGSQGQILTASTTFFGFPYKIGAVLLFGLVVLGAIVYRARGRIKLALKVLFSGKKI